MQLQRFSVSVTLLGLTQAYPGFLGSLGRLGLSTDTTCSAIADTWKGISQVEPCILNACSSPPTINNGKCEELTSLFKDSVSKYPCVSDEVCTVTTTPSSTTTSGPSNNNVIIGSYYPPWMVYGKIYMGPNNINVHGGTATPDNAYAVYPSTVEEMYPQLTHLYYTFWDVDKKCRVMERDPDASWNGANVVQTWIKFPTDYCKGAQNEFMRIKTKYPELKIMMSVGGWSFSKYFSACAKTEEGRKDIFTTMKWWFDQMDENWGKSNGLWNGVDLDWEYPAVDAGLYPDHDADDWFNFGELVKSIKASAKADGRELIVSAAVGAGLTLTEFATGPSKNAQNFCENIDLVNLMTYDLHGKFDSTTGHNAPFCVNADPASRPDPQLKWSVKDAVEKITAYCPKNKVVLGMPAFSHAWASIPNVNNGLYQKSTSDQWVGWSTFSDSDVTYLPQGIIHYWDMKKTLAGDSDFKVYTAYTCKEGEFEIPVKYVYHAVKQVFATYDDAETLALKTKWAKSIGLAGVFTWDITQDKEGEVLAALRDAWGGLTLGTTNDEKKCFDDHKPKFYYDPLTNQPMLKGCFTKGDGVKSVVQGKDGAYCSNLKVAAATACGNPAIAVGGSRKGQSACIMPCALDWGTGNDMLQVEDTIYFVCSEDEVDKLDQ